MRRALPLLVLALLVLPQAGLGQAAALPTVKGSIEGYGTASSFFIRAGGYALEGGVNDWTLVCGGCFVRISVTESSFVLVQEGALVALPPGVYELREFRGYLSHSPSGGAYFVTLAGAGHLVAL